MYNEREITIRPDRSPMGMTAYSVDIDGFFAFRNASKANALHNAKLWIDRTAYWSAYLKKWVAVPQMPEQSNEIL
jgi:hypothetical protein